MDGKVNVINWFEISVSDIKRAKKFYETIFEIEMSEMSMLGSDMAFFPMEDGNGKVSGALVQGPMHTASDKGVLIYMNANPDLNTVLDKIEGAGGKVVMPKTEIGPDMGFMAFFIDTEANKIGLHSSK